VVLSLFFRVFFHLQDGGFLVINGVLVCEGFGMAFLAFWLQCFVCGGEIMAENELPTSGVLH